MPTAVHDRYIADVQDINARMSLRGLAGRIEPASLLYLARRPDGLVVLAAHARGIPQRYLLGIGSFRLAEYLRLRYADDEVAYARALFAEPATGHGNEIHVLAMDEASGAIYRYMSLVGSADAEPMGLLDPRRTAFPCELAHRTNVFAHVPLSDVDTSNVWEAKRLVQRGGATGLGARLRLTLELMLGFYTALGRITPTAKVLVGDGEEGVAITRLVRSLREVHVLEGTEPSLPEGDLMRGLYTQRESVKAFVARAPHGTELDDLIGTISDALAERDPLIGFKQLVGQVGGAPRRVQVCA
jgi:hypothetical protein